MSLKRTTVDFESTREPMRIPAWSNGNRGDNLGCRDHVACRHPRLPLENQHKQRTLVRRRTARLAAMQRRLEA